MRKFKAVIFDMDGLMFNSENLWIKACIECGKKYGINITEDFIKQNGIGRNANDIKQNFMKEFPR